MKKLLILMMLLPFPVFSYSVIGESPGTTCMKVYDGGQRWGNQTSIRFFSTCPSRVYMKVCVVDDRNRAKLYTSPTYIDTAGNYTISTMPGDYPKVVTWTADLFDAPVPSMCRSVSAT